MKGLSPLESLTRPGPTSVCRLFDDGFTMKTNGVMTILWVIKIERLSVPSSFGKS